LLSIDIMDGVSEANCACSDNAVAIVVASCSFISKPAVCIDEIIVCGVSACSEE